MLIDDDFISQLLLKATKKQVFDRLTNFDNEFYFIIYSIYLFMCKCGTLLNKY